MSVVFELILSDTFENLTDKFGFSLVLEGLLGGGGGGGGSKDCWIFAFVKIIFWNT
jgi:hypothetical protein